MNLQCGARAVGPRPARPSDRRIMGRTRASGSATEKNRLRNRDWSRLDAVTSSAMPSDFLVYKIANCIQFARLENDQPPAAWYGVRSAHSRGTKPMESIP
jgi:hypothetical protein